MVEIQFPLVDGKPVTLIEKTVMFEAYDDLATEATCPVSVRVGCEVLHTELDQSGAQVAVVTLEYDMEDHEGNKEFRISTDLLED
ncbi:hypothetical protein [Nocardia abscessus]|uniref:hypothetical protein n=1 Tax=Nocardia abscessus TaxID=120957 RepID=UPI0024565C04|nr:hypothetical protein [Nocardia abscessus]